MSDVLAEEFGVFGCEFLEDFREDEASGDGAVGSSHFFSQGDEVCFGKRAVTFGGFVLTTSGPFPRSCAGAIG